MGTERKIEISDTQDETNKAAVKPKSLAPFPAVVCFYRSAEQRSRDYGTDEKYGIPKFGFDNYIPFLYGTNSLIRDSYKRNLKIVSGYTATDKDGNNVEVYLYPHNNEREYKSVNVLDTNYLTNGQELKYFCPWLNPPSNSESMELYVSLFYPDPAKMSPKDEFIEHKDSANEDKDVEKVYFKLVHVSKDWQPKETVDGNFQYAILNQNIPISEEDQNDRDRLPTLKQELQDLETAIKELDDCIKTDEQTLKVNRITNDEKLEKRNKKANEQIAVNEKYRSTHETTLITDSQNLNKEIVQLDKERNKLKQDNLELEGSIKDNKADLTIKNDLHKTQSDEI